MTATHVPTATLTMTRGPEVGRGFYVGATTVTIGRYGECDIQVRDTWVSRWHARITWTGAAYIVEDLGSTNGTYVNGQRVGAPRALRSGDRLQLGEQVEFAFQVGVPVPSGKIAVPAGVRPSPGRSASPSEAMPTFIRSIAEQKGPAHRRRRIGIWVLVTLVTVVSLIVGGGAYYLLSDGGKEPAPTVTAVRATATPPTWLTLDGTGDDGTLEVPEINLWNDYDDRWGAGKAGVGRHGERVKLIRRSGDGVKIELPDGTQGWVTYWFIKEYK